MAENKQYDPNMSDEEFNEYLAGYRDAPEEAEAAAAEASSEGAAQDAAEEAAALDAAEEAAPYKSFATEDEYNSTLDEYADGKYADRLSQADTDAQIISRINRPCQQVLRR